MGSYCLIVNRFPVLDNEKVLEPDSDDGCTILGM